MVVKVLGPTETGSEPLSPRERTILSALIVRMGSTVSPAQLADAWWNGREPATWEQQVRNSVARIRARLGRSAVETVGWEYRLGLDPDVIDSVRFERLVSTARQHALASEDERAVDAYRRALALWRGAPLQDLTAWEPGVVEALRLDEIRTSAEEELIDARLAAGDHRAVIADAERLVREQPLREGRWAALAIANYRCDRQGEALAVVRAARERLAADLGIDVGDRLAAVETGILRREAWLAPPSQPSSASDVCPYAGLRAFGPAEATMFFGRDDDIEAVLERVGPGTVVAIAGSSGSGKSSLLLAGVMPRLGQRGTPTAVIRVHSAPASALRAAAETARVIGIDQAEELLQADAESLAEFGEAARAALDDGLCIVLTVRSDALDAARALPGLGGDVGRGIYLLGALTAGQCRAVIEEPAESSGLRLEPGLVELAMRDAADRAETLPLLSHALRETWERREGSTLTVAGYEAAGGIAGAIAQSAESVFQELSPAERSACRSIMLRLVERGTDGMSSRRRIAVGPLLGDTSRRVVLERLVAARLVSLDESTVTIAHEALATAWPRLDAWLDEDADNARIMRSIETAATAWDASERADDDLLRGARLHAAIDWRTASTADLTEVENGFLDASIAEEEATLRDLEMRSRRDRSHNRRLRWALGSAAGLLVVALAAGGVAVVRGQDAAAAAEDQRIEALAATSLSLRATDRDVAALLAAELHHRWPDDSRSRSALFGVVSAPGNPVARTAFPVGTLLSGALIPGTRTALVVVDAVDGPIGSPDAERGAPRIIDIDTGETVRALSATVPPTGTNNRRDVVVSDDGSTAVIQSSAYRTPGDGGTCCVNLFDVIDLDSGDNRFETVVLDARTGTVPTISPDRTRLYLIHSITGEPMVLDLVSGEVAIPYPRSPAEFESGIGEVNGQALIGDRLYVGAVDGIRVWDAETLVSVESIPTPAPGLAEWLLEPDGRGGLLTSGENGTAHLTLATGEFDWVRTGRSQTCDPAVVVAEAFLCGQLQGIVEQAVKTGMPTGREFTTQSDWTHTIDVVAGGRDFVTINLRDTAALVTWHLDGSPAIVTPIADGRMLFDGFDGRGALVVTAATPPTADEDAGPVQLWDVATDSPVGAEVDGLTWVSGDIYEEWDLDEGSTLRDVRTGAVVTLDETMPTDNEYWVASGEHGPYSFMVENRRITPFVTDTGMRAGPSIDVDVDFFDLGLSISEIPSTGRFAVTWFDVSRATAMTTVFDIASGTQVARGLPGDIQTVGTPDGQLVSASAARLTRSSGDLEPLFALPKSGVGPNSMQSTVDGSTMLMTGHDGRIALYDLRDGRKLGDEIPSGVFRPDWPGGFLSPDGSRMAITTEDGVQVWDLTPEHQFEAACRMAGRDFTDLEWNSYFPGEPHTDTCDDINP